MKGLLNSIILICSILSGQAERQISTDSIISGIQFQQDTYWKQVLAKAKKEGKYIFVDCYATWCGPCMKMEKEVYSLPKIGDIYNEKFISLKIQMDSAKTDNKKKKLFYADARFFESHYKINAYPCLLFFMPDGRILNKFIGALKPDDFVQLTADVIDPQKNYYLLLDKYKKGKSDLKEMNFLAHTALQLLGDTAQSQGIAQSYVLNLNKEAWFTKSNIEFMREFTKNSRDTGFSIFYHYTDSINKIMGDTNYAQSFVNYIIYKEIVVPEIRKVSGPIAAIPDWNSIGSMIRNKYNDYYSERVIIGAKSDWGRRYKNWPECTKYMVLFTEKYGTLNAPGQLQDFMLNNYAWEVFLHSNNKNELETALVWSNRALTLNPQANWMDTYANILYKLGRKEQAIKWEEIARELAPLDANIKMNLEKIKNGKPTWRLE